MTDADGHPLPTTDGHGESSRIGAASGSASAANGTRKSQTSSQNGSVTRNGKTPASPYYGHNREEVTRILIQALSDMGYQSAAAMVSQDSGYNLESPDVATFRDAVSSGQWATAESLLFGATAAESASEATGNGLVLAPEADTKMMRFWLSQQKFLELLEQRDTTMALHVLRNEVTPLCQDTGRLHFLSSLLMCGSPEEVRARSLWDGSQGQSRHQLLSQLSTCISPAVMLPEHRLASLLHQAKSAQVARCLYHSDASPPSLYCDHQCSKDDFPLELIGNLDMHDGEVWQLKFSHDGKRLATCGSEKEVIIWDVPTFNIVTKLDDDNEGVGNLAWSPDDSMIVTCCQDRYARLWDATTGALRRRLDRQTEPVSSCVWLPDGMSFMTGALDLNNSITLWSSSGDRILDWGKKHRVEDLALSPDLRWVVAMTDKHTIHVYDFATQQEERTIDLGTRLFSVNISQDSRHMLVNTKNGDIFLYDMGTWEVIQEYKAGPYSDCIIRSGFGGANESFVYCGRENGEVLIFHKTTGVTVASIMCHKPRCNSASWNPADPRMFATCGDDGKVKVWSTQAHMDKLQDSWSEERGIGFPAVGSANHVWRQNRG